MTKPTAFLFGILIGMALTIAIPVLIIGGSPVLGFACVIALVGSIIVPILMSSTANSSRRG
ncbi:hypothetical protein [Bacillus thuringiensis]|uniref:hypothetical protein n=1 Tax=Bacillus thuringiensis TaxID=1428 RepID=UPI000BF38134|nr:hypothetical protein [Bacillus thuringiensis]EKS7858186.1 hypothetical protein [Bacillus cereus]PEV64102.1 hypothetical protein CN434_25175 [Bacillus thuringiensis]